MPTKKIIDREKNSHTKKTDITQKKIKNLKREIKHLKQELKEKNDKLLRSYADLQNYQKRIEKELQYKEDETKKKYLSELIELNEVLKKVYEDKDPKGGLKLILNNLENFFEKEQIKYIDCMGKTFDHNMHHAVTTIEKNDCEDGTIVEEIKKGYLVDNKLLRPSQVVVVKKKKNE
ncbi:molecular chaperone GrpE (heat shock protein) [Thermoplasmatales archaeon SCGC AB-539-N05]|nr:molecular chaperone GrpE (heat shock protein) [Thermoplasmatales archaeon SCGC AB-539-N05]